jgi:hypothetical protein
LSAVRTAGKQNLAQPPAGRLSSGGMRFKAATAGQP